MEFFRIIIPMICLKTFLTESITLNELSKKLKISKDQLSQCEAQKYLIDPLKCLQTTLNDFNNSHQNEINKFFDSLSDFSKQFQEKGLLVLEDSVMLSKPEKISSEIDSLISYNGTFSTFGQIKSKFQVMTTEFMNVDMKFRTFQARINGLLQKHSEEKNTLEKMDKKNQMLYLKIQSELTDLNNQTCSLNKSKEEIERNISDLTSKISNKNSDIIKNSKLLELETEVQTKKLKEQLDLNSEICYQEQELNEQKYNLSKERTEKSSCQSKIRDLKEEMESYERRKNSEISSLRSKRDELEDKKKAGAALGVIGGIGSLFLMPVTLGGSVAAYAASVAAMIAAIKHYSDEIDKVYDEINSNRRYYDSKISDKNKDLEKTEANISSLESNIWWINYQMNSKKESLDKKYKEISEINAKLEECNKKIKEKKIEKASLEADFKNMNYEAEKLASEIKEKNELIAQCQTETQKLQSEMTKNEKILQEIKENIKIETNCLSELEKLRLPKEFLEGVNASKNKIDNFDDQLRYISNEFEKNLRKIKKNFDDFEEMMELDEEIGKEFVESCKNEIKNNIEQINLLIKDLKHSLSVSDPFLMLRY